MTVKKILRTRTYKAGYIVEEALMEGSEFGCADFVIKSARTLEGLYIGDPLFAYRLCHKRGIKPEKASPEHTICSIGFSERSQLWFGWSHRALFGFGVGSVAKEGDCCTTSGWTEEYLEQHPEERTKVIPVGFEARSLDDAKRMAIAFAASVS